jgi:hypothetical protein
MQPVMRVRRFLSGRRSFLRAEGDLCWLRPLRQEYRDREDDSRSRKRLRSRSKSGAGSVPFLPDGDQKKRTMNTAAKQRSMITPHLRALRRILRTRPRIRKLPLSMVALFVGQPGQHRLLLSLQVMCQDGCSERNVVCFVERAAVRRNRRTSAGGARLDAGQLPTIRNHVPLAGRPIRSHVPRWTLR